MLVYNIINETINGFLQDLLTEDQERTIRNKIARGVAAITHLDSASTEVQTMTDEVLKNYVEHPMHDGVHKRQNNEIWAINFVINRMMPYIIRQRSDGSFFVNKNPRLKNAWENLIQAQSTEHVSKMPVWNSDDSLHYWNANKRYNDAMEAAKKQDGKTIEGQGNYSVYHIDGYNAPIEDLGMTLYQLGTYTGGKGKFSSRTLCFTDTLSMYNDFTKDNKYDMYALLRDDWKEQTEKCVVDESTFPFDSYGLSMIFVVIDNNGQLFHSNVRWNHGPKGYDVGSKVDNIFTYSKLVEVVGSNVMNQIGAKEETYNDVLLTYEVEQKLKQGIPIRDIFYYISDESNGYCMVAYNRMANYIDTQTNELLSDVWFDKADSFSNGFARVGKDGKLNYIREDGTLVWDKSDTNEWFDSCYNFSNGFARVGKDDKYNYLRENGTLVWDTLDTNEWFDVVYSFEDGFVKVEKDNKYNYLRENGTLVWDKLDTNEWFDWVGNFFGNGIAEVQKDYKVNYIRTNGTLVWDTLDTNEWFDAVVRFSSGFAQVKKRRKWNFLREDGTLVWDTLNINKWFDYVDSFFNGFAQVEKDDKWNYIRENGTLVWPYKDTNKWFNFCYRFRNGFAIVKKGGKCNLLRTNGTFVLDTLDTNEWFDDVYNFVNGLAIVKKGGKCNFIRTNGTLVWPYEDTNKWFDKVDDFFGKGFAIVHKGGKLQYLSKDGKLYDEIPTTDNIIQECINRYLNLNLVRH